MSGILSAAGLGKRYRRRWALRDCTLDVPAGHVVGLVGPNGAGKSTLLQLAVGLLAPSAGSLTVIGAPPSGAADWLSRIGFVAQDAPVYPSLSVSDHLRWANWSNAAFDRDGARRRCDSLGLDPRQKAGRLSGGQRAQLALTLALAKRPQLLVLDEPAASLDPLARREFLDALMEAVAADGLSVIVSSHLIGDLERICDYLVVLTSARVQLAGPIEALLASHHQLLGATRDSPGERVALAAGQEVIAESRAGAQRMLLIRDGGPARAAGGALADPAWSVTAPSLEDLVLAYIARDGRGGAPAPGEGP
ncbi:MAG: ABC transporter ATP-binding protein [Frankiaceae bacterium]|jgi:ABC-2 type transport system ATP-binding protein|nr:ABC transporter ATP-binding protein [Frankiaceae bacterium]